MSKLTIEEFYIKNNNKQYICNICNGNEFRIYSRPFNNKDYYYKQCITCKRKQNNKVYKDHLDFFNKFKIEKGCKFCGFNKHPACLELHHLNKLEKSFTISKYKGRMSFDKLKLELDKCIVLCANCHRLEHYKEKENES